MSSDQAHTWQGEFGEAYTARNPKNRSELDALYTEQFGRTRTSLNELFLNDLPRDLRMLEVGTNVGAQLDCLRAMGFTNLTGVEIQTGAIQQAQRALPDAQFVCASAFGLPFPDASFDLVFTSGVLIHIAPEDLARTQDEVVRCARRYIWGWEYYAKDLTEIPYHGNERLMWKGDYAAMYRERDPNLHMFQHEIVPYLKNDNADMMFLLEKGA